MQPFDDPPPPQKPPRRTLVDRIAYVLCAIAIWLAVIHEVL